MTAAEAHSPCCSSHGRDLSCVEYRRTHFVEARPCCAEDAELLRRERRELKERVLRLGFVRVPSPSVADMHECRRCLALTLDPMGHEEWHGTLDPYGCLEGMDHRWHGDTVTTGRSSTTWWVCLRPGCDARRTTTRVS